MNSNEKKEDVIIPSNFSIIERVTILRLETDPASYESNKVRVTFQDSHKKNS
ncbi:hypothetical protein XBP1_2750003 [Xenorhabdus bovienii str. puntauvense]|uniref:Uncharacterized protein n=1 Tax=Xenorhabdus bovienii str. puntauvense TaxID=1398201 RepID=A0A077NG14_XENBV|nr:hypothetical protein XBP1_2750003 [Xenorhabdus bovienii str. puntauvense]